MSVTQLAFLDMRLRRDDGAIVYLNGTEVWRENMPAGPVDYLTRAGSAIGVPDEVAFQFFIRPVDSLLTVGTNVFSVELHQVSPTSSDVHSDFSCTALTSGPSSMLTRGPYLQSGSHTSAVVRWRTDFPSESWVYYGDTPGNLTATSIVSAITDEHAVTVTGLLPYTR